jgi:hypothetical protein
MNDLWKIITNLFKSQKKSEQPTSLEPTPSVEPPISPTPVVIPLPMPSTASETIPTTKKETSVSTTSTATNFPRAKTRSEATLRYGKIVSAGGKLTWPGEATWMAMFVMPAGFEHVINTASGKPTTRIYCNKDLHAPLKLALQNLLDRGLAKEFKTFDGCFMLRMVRGTTDALSTHGYGLAIDLNAAENGLGKEPKLSAEFVKCFKDAGFQWGGDFSRKDGMHVSFAWE